MHPNYAIERGKGIEAAAKCLFLSLDLREHVWLLDGRDSDQLNQGFDPAKEGPHFTAKKIVAN